MKRQTRININEGVMVVGLMMAGFVVVPFPFYAFLFMILGIMGYTEVARIVSNGRCIPFWERGYKQWKYGKKSNMHEKLTKP